MIDSLERKHILPIGIIIILISFYTISLNSPFIMDDLEQIMANKKIQGSDGIMGVIKNGSRQTRVIQNLSFFLDWKISGGKTWSFHLQNLMWHAVCTFLVFLIFSRLFPNERFLQYLVLVFFCIHPLQHQSVVYIMGRVSLIQGFFYLLSLYLVLFCPHKKWLRALIVFIGLFAKESLLILPLFLLLCDTIYSEKVNRQFTIKNHWPSFLILIPGVLFWYWLGNPVTLYSRSVALDLYPFWEHLLTQGLYYLFYIFLFLNPSWQSLSHYTPDFSSAIAVIGFICILSVIILAIYLLKRKSRHSIFLILFLLTVFQLAPSNTILQMQNPFAEYRFYLSNLLLIYMVSLFLFWFKNKFNLRVATIVAGCFLLYFVSFNFAHQLTWRDTFKVYDYTLQLYPNSPRAHYGLGVEFAHIGDLKKAEEHLIMAIDLAKKRGRFNSLIPYYILGYIYVMEERLDSAYNLLHPIDENWSKKKIPPSIYQLKLNMYHAKGFTEEFDKTLKEARDHFPGFEFVPGLPEMYGYKKGRQ